MTPRSSQLVQSLTIPAGSPESGILDEALSVHAIPQSNLMDFLVYKQEFGKRSWRDGVRTTDVP